MFYCTGKTIVAVPTTDGVQSKQLRDKLKELETEIEKFRIENAKLNALRSEREQVTLLNTILHY